MKKFKEVEACIDTLTIKGNGLGNFKKDDGTSSPLEVPFTLAGEKVTATLIKRKRGVFHGRLEAVLKASPDRILPRCVHFGECGGCRFQHLSYAKQLEKKQEGISELYSEHRSLICPIITSPRIFAYRNKMEFSFSSDVSGNRYLGLVKANSYHVVDLIECHLVNPWFLEAVCATRSWWEETGLNVYKRQNGTLRTLTVREGQNTGDRMVMLTISGEFLEAESWVRALRERLEPFVGNLSLYLREQKVAKGVSTTFKETLLYGRALMQEVLCGLSFSVSPTAFFQPNPLQAENLIKLSIGLADIQKHHVVYDLYCGTGVLGLYAACFAKEVIGVEVCIEAVENACQNARRNSVFNYRAVAGSVRDILRSGELPFPDIVIVNPPRSGLEKETIDWLMEVGVKKIIYISCNPLTQKRDVTFLIGSGYEITAIQPVDQFPHTIHVENIILLEK